MVVAGDPEADSVARSHRDIIAERYELPSPSELSALPEARATMTYEIADLLPFTGDTFESTVYRLREDAPIYGEDRSVPVARLAATNFLDEPTVVTVTRFSGEWALVLTPSRIALPSGNGGTAPAQSVGWIRSSNLVESHPQTRRVLVDAAAQTLTITDWAGSVLGEYPVGVGGADTPTPTGATYIQARYLDPSQGQPTHRIQLTGAYSEVADAPWLDSAHAGLHFSEDVFGESHGCVRMTAEGIEAVDSVPLGTPVIFE